MAANKPITYLISKYQVLCDEYLLDVSQLTIEKERQLLAILADCMGQEMPDLPPSPACLLGHILWLKTLYKDEDKTSAREFVRSQEIWIDSMILSAKSWGVGLTQEQKMWLAAL